MEIAGDDGFRIRSYRNGAATIESYPERIADILANPNAKITDVPGIGKGLAAVLAEIDKRGSCDRRDELLLKFPPAALDFLKIQGLGPKSIAVLFENFQVRTVDELEQLCKDQKLRTLPRMGAKLEEKVLRSIAAYKERSGRFLLSFADNAAQEIAASLADLGLPLFGKTGTTTGPTNVWFVGGSPNLIAGTYIGYDQPRSLGGYAQGATYAVPIFRQFLMATRDQWDHTPFTAPPGVSLVKIDRVTGQPVFGGEASDAAGAEVIWEAFKPETEPQRPSRQAQLGAKRQELIDEIRRGFAAINGQPVQTEPAPPGDFTVDKGGVY